MNRKLASFLTLVAALSIAAATYADVMDRPVGIQIGERMTLKPYVALSVGYDSNVEGFRDGADDVVWLVNPGLGLEYKAIRWSFLLNVWYQYNDYVHNRERSQMSYHAYGEEAQYRWRNSIPGEKGWSVMFSERFLKTNENEGLMDSMGHSYGRDREEFKLAAGVQRRFNEALHADVNANYYWLDYVSSNKQKLPVALYGWERWGIGAEAGYALSGWTDLMIAGSYQRYDTDNRNNNYFEKTRSYGRSSGSEGMTLQVGLGSYATEKITYRFLGGISTYSYDEGGSDSSGFSYTATGNWQISETWKTMFMATSYYQPTEQEYGSSQRVDAINWGLAHSLIQNKLHANLDLAYRRQGREHTETESYDYDLDILSARLGLTYIFNRYLQVFGDFEFRDQWCEQDDTLYGERFAFERYRVTVGLRFTY